MKKSIKILSALLAMLMVILAFPAVSGATETDKQTEGEENEKTGIPILKSKEKDTEDDYKRTVEEYLRYVDNKDNSGEVYYKTPQEKLASMKMMWENYGYQLWIDEVTGETATVKLSTGEILFSNPWDTPTATYADNSKKTSLAVKKQLLSQIVVNYVDNDTDKTMYSCEEAAMNNQINVEYIKNGIRVEYSIGREETRMLLPKLIERTRFETKILKPMREHFNEITKDEANGVTQGCYDLILANKPDFDMSGEMVLGVDHFYVLKTGAYYTLKDTSEAETDREKSETEAAFPITKKMPVYVFDSGASANEMANIESFIKNYATTYTYEDMDYDHELTEYVGTEKAPPLFKMALEYTLDAQGMTVRLPANGIRFDQSLYQLESIEMLPYMGAGINDNDFNDGGDGYTFFPDGSGTLFDFEQLNTGRNKIVSGKVYGQDFAYHTITGTNQESIRYPVFGVVDYWTGNKTVTDYDTITNQEKYAAGEEPIYGTKEVKVQEDKGFLAIIEEGDALAELSTYHMSATSVYNTVKMIFYPRPKDSYDLTGAISVGTNTTLTVVSDRKYVGNYKVRYIMLSDDEIAKENNLTNYYECSWMGMAVAYRDYLERNSVLDRLKAEDVDDDIPLYIETFGTVFNTEKFLSVPVDVMTPLTTFEDVKTMYGELSSAIEASMAAIVQSGEAIATTEESAAEFSNINFKLTGYANGGVFSSVPYHLNWEKAVGGASGFEELVEDAKENGFNIFPDFDFVYVNATDTLDGLSMKRDLIKTIDNRYTSRREYNATFQSYVGYFQYAISPSSFERFVTKLSINYLKYNPTGIAVSTLGTDLNSDFDEEDPLNREDSKSYTVEALRQLSQIRNSDGERVQIMTDGGNAYSWRYVDYIVNMPLNSSRYNDSSNAVPFIGVVLHGFVQFAGTPINEEGDIEYAFLKAIENGASIYFTLSYQNTDVLKEYERLSEHYSVRYDIWQEDMVAMYTRLNNLLADLQTKLIIDHEFLTGERIPDDDEAQADIEAAEKAAAEEAAKKELAAVKEALKAALTLRHTPANSVETIESALTNINDQAIAVSKNVAKIDKAFVDECAEIVRTVNSAKTAANNAKKTTYSTEAYDAAVLAAQNALRDPIGQNAIMMANEVVENTIDEITDVAAAKAAKTAADKAIKYVLEATVAAGAEEVFRQATNENPVFTSDSDEAAYRALEAQAVVETVIEAATDAADSAVSNTEAELRTIVDRVVGVMLEEIVNGFVSSNADSAITLAATAYKNVVTASDKLIDDATTALVEVQTTIKNAKEAGISEADINEVIALKNAAQTANNKVTAMLGNQTVYARAVAAIVTTNTSYYTTLNSYLTEAIKDSNLKADVTIVKNYYKAAIDAAVYELSYSIDGSITSATNSKANYDRTAALATTEKAKVDDIEETRRNSAIAKLDEISALMLSVVTDTAAQYDTTLNLLNEYYDKLEAIYVDAAGSDTALVEAIIAVNNSNRRSGIVALARVYASMDSSIMAQATYAAANAANVAAQATVSAIAAETVTNAKSLISDKDITTKTNAVSKDEWNLQQRALETAGRYIAYLDAVANRDSLLDLYREFAANIDIYNGEKTVANAALQTEKTAGEKAAVDKTLADKSEEYNKVAAEEALATADDIIRLLTELNTKQAEYNVAEAAFNISAEKYNSTFGATVSETRDYNNKLTAKNKAETALATAKTAYDDAYDASNFKDQFQAVVDAKNAVNAVEQTKSLIDAVISAEGKAVDRTFPLSTELMQSVNTNFNYVMLNNSLTAKTADYLKYVNDIKAAANTIGIYARNAKTVLEDAEAATVLLKERITTTQDAADAAGIPVRVYSAAILVASYSAEELAERYEDLQATSSAPDITALSLTDYSNAIAVSGKTVAELEAAKNSAAEADKAQATLLYDIAVAVEENTLNRLNTLHENAVETKEAADRTAIGAVNFYNTAVQETEYANTKYTELMKVYDESMALYNSVAVLEARTLLFSNTNITTSETAAYTNIKTANNAIEKLLDSLEKSTEAWASLEAAAARQKAARVEHARLQAEIEKIGYENMTETQKTEYQASLIVQSYKKIVEQSTIEETQKIINDYCLIFRQNYQAAGSSLLQFNAALEKVKDEANSAKQFYEVLLADTTADATILAEAKAKSDEYNEIVATLQSIYDEAYNTYYKQIGPQGYELGLLNVRDETVPEDERTYALVGTFVKLTNFIAELNETVTEAEEVVEATKYTCDDGTIVAVTYGGKDGEDQNPYRTFLLNFNAFSVTVIYDEEKPPYEIAPYSYCVINY